MNLLLGVINKDIRDASLSCVNIDPRVTRFAFIASTTFAGVIALVVVVLAEVEDFVVVVVVVAEVDDFVVEVVVLVLVFVDDVDDFLDVVALVLVLVVDVDELDGGRPL